MLRGRELVESVVIAVDTPYWSENWIGRDIWVVICVNWLWFESSELEWRSAGRIGCMKWTEWRWGIHSCDGLLGGRWMVVLRVERKRGKLNHIGHNTHAAQGEHTLNPCMVVIFVVERCLVSSLCTCSLTSS